MLSVLEAGKSKMKEPEDLVPGESHFSQMAPSCCVLTWWTGLITSLRPSFIRTLILLMRALFSWTCHLPRTPPFSTNTLGIRFKDRNFGGTQTLRAQQIPVPKECMTTCTHSWEAPQFKKKKKLGNFVSDLVLNIFGQRIFLRMLATFYNVLHNNMPLWEMLIKAELDCVCFRKAIHKYH